MPTMVESLIAEMPLSANWEREVFDLKGHYTAKDFRKALIYVRERSTFVAKGSSRAVFKVEYEGRPTVIKMAMNKAGLAQNEAEANVVFDGALRHSEALCPGIDYDQVADQPVWIHAEFATAIKSEKEEDRLLRAPDASPHIRHVEFGDLILCIQSMQTGSIWDDQIGQMVRGSSDKIIEICHHRFGLNPNLDIINSLYELWGNLGWPNRFLSDLRYRQNWGIYQNRLVVLDIGADDEVLSTHYTGLRPRDPGGWKAPRAPRESPRDRWLRTRN